MLRRQRSAPAQLPAPASPYMTGEAAGQRHTGAGHSPVPWHHSGHGGTLAWLWAKPLGCSFTPWLPWPRRRQQKLCELRPGLCVPARGGGSQVALWKRWSGHGCDRARAGTRQQRAGVKHGCGALPAPRRAQVSGGAASAPQPSPAKPPHCLQQEKLDMGAAGSALQGFSAPRVTRVTPPCPPGTPVPTAGKGPVQQQC